MKILITGSEGYLGGSLKNLLIGKYDITGVCRKDFNLSIPEETRNFFNKNYFDVVIHCSVSGGHRLKKDPWGVMDNNIKMYYNLLDNRKKFGKLINFGSGAEIHDSESPYGLSKKVISKSVSGIENFYNLRIYSVFDENELETRFIKNGIFRYLEKTQIEILDQKIMGFFYMLDLVKLVEHYINNENLPKEIDCVYKNNYTLFEVAEKINSLGDHRVKIIPSTSSKFTKYCGEFTDLGISYIGLEEGIKRTYNKLKNV